MSPLLATADPTSVPSVVGVVTGSTGPLRSTLLTVVGGAVMVSAGVFTLARGWAQYRRNAGRYGEWGGTQVYLRGESAEAEPARLDWDHDFVRTRDLAAETLASYRTPGRAGLAEDGGHGDF